ncbi:ras and Rab interactor 3-like, partial [Clarias magur]
DILPCTLKLPLAIIQAIKYEDMEVISTLGVEFWGSELNSHSRDDSGKPEEERKLPSGNDRLWYINPISIEEYHNSLPPNSPTPILRSQSLNVPVQAQPKFKRPPPLPPRPLTISEDSLTQVSAKAAKEKLTSEESSLLSLSSSLPSVQKEEGSHCGYKKAEGTLLPSAEAEMWNKQDAAQLSLSETTEQGSNAPSHKIPPVPLRRRISEGQPSGDDGQLEPIKETVCASEAAETSEDPGASVSLICLDDSNMDQWVSEQCGQSKTPQEEDLGEKSKASNGVSTANMIPVLETKKPGAPVPPPRRKRTSQSLISQGAATNSEGVNQELSHVNPQPTPRLQNLAEHPKVPDVSLFSPEGGAPQPDHDSYSTSSTEEEAEPGTPVGALAKRTSTIILDRAKQRLSMVNFSTVFTSFMSTDRKLQKRIVELARDGSTYFGNLVQDYRAFTLDTMRRHSTSTEMLQEIRQMMTQLKSYLIQSTELQNLQEAAIYSEDKLEIIIEASLYKSVLKPLREAIYNGLRDIHSRAGNLKKLKENQLTVLGTTTTDLGVTTCVPDSPVMEKIQGKLGNLHQEYSPQKKIDLLLKTCKIIYESMSVGCPGKPYGADDFLPVLMYVLARCNISALLLDVEYMMELMDPALQLGEGSYYLTTTYGAVEHIKNYDKQAASKQLSLEIQDSIHRWERRRTLNKARASHSSIQ